MLNRIEAQENAKEKSLFEQHLLYFIHESIRQSRKLDLILELLEKKQRGGQS